MRKMLHLPLALAAAGLLTISCGETGAGNTAGRSATNTANAAAATTGSAPVNTAAIETEIKKLVSDTAAALAKNDVAALDKIYADDYMLVNVDGSVQKKAERLASMRSGETKFESFTYEDVNIRVNPEGTGAVTISKAMAKGMNKGQPVAEGGVRVTQVWSKTKDGWKQMSGHAVAITAANSNAAKPPEPAKN